MHEKHLKATEFHSDAESVSFECEVTFFRMKVLSHSNELVIIFE